MPVRIHGKKDSKLQRIGEALQRYVDAHPEAKIDLFRRHTYSAPVRIVDPRFEKMGFIRRHKSVWQYLDSVPEDILMLVRIKALITPAEKKDSFGSREFDQLLARKRRRKALAAKNGTPRSKAG
jgi:stress-induced morphogen